jgi:hypothetical protein
MTEQVAADVCQGLLVQQYYMGAWIVHIPLLLLDELLGQLAGIPSFAPRMNSNLRNYK